MAVLNLAHRGASGHAPENTVVAVQTAVLMGADLVEVDVQQTRDGRLVVMHDTALTRTTDAEARFPERGAWQVGDFTHAEICQLDAGSWFGDGQFAGTLVPTLSEVLDVLEDADVGLMLEAKSPKLSPGVGERIVNELRARPRWGGDRRLIVQSFDWEFVQDFGKLMPEAELGLIGVPEPGDLTGLSKHADLFVSERGSFDAGFVRDAHELGMEVYSWTIDEPSMMREAMEIGVDGVITNKPDVLDELLCLAGFR